MEVIEIAFQAPPFAKRCAGDQCATGTGLESRTATNTFGLGQKGDYGFD